MPASFRRVLSLSVLLGPAAQLACAAAPADRAPANESILAEQLRADLHFLASDALGGRLTGTPEVAVAAEFIKARFERLGLSPAGPDGSFFQPFDLVWFSLGSDNALTVEGGGASRSRLVPGEEYYPLNFSGTSSARGEVAFAGFGIVEPRLAYDDYRGADVSGKIVLVLEREPGVDDPESPFDGVVTAEASRGWRKALAAQERGAVGILFVRDVHNREDIGDFAQAHAASWPAERRRIERFSLAVWMDRIRIPAAQISASLAGRLTAGSGRTLEELAADAEAAEGGLGVIDLPGVTVELSASVDRNVTAARNVVARMEGSDPELADEVVILGAHHDHNGSDDGGVYNGADDDGSGIVGLLELAEAYSAAALQGMRPRRSVLFAAWDAEERGLLGAWYYTEDPLFPLESTAGVLNMDMIGRNEEVPEEGGGRFRGLEPQTASSNAEAVNILGHTYSSGMTSEVTRANEEYGLLLRMRYDNNASNLLRRSDHWPFLQRGVPALWFHTGLHPDYHTRRDDPEIIHYEKMEKIVRLVHQMSWNLAMDEERASMDGER